MCTSAIAPALHFDRFLLPGDFIQAFAAKVQPRWRKKTKISATHGSVRQGSGPVWLERGAQGFFNDESLLRNCFHVNPLMSE